MPFSAGKAKKGLFWLKKLWEGRKGCFLGKIRAVREFLATPSVFGTAAWKDSETLNPLPLLFHPFSSYSSESSASDSEEENNEEIKSYYERKVNEEKKNKMSVINAVRNKLILRIFACVNQKRKYEKHYTYTLA